MSRALSRLPQKALHPQVVMYPRLILHHLSLLPVVRHHSQRAPLLQAAMYLSLNLQSSSPRPLPATMHRSLKQRLLRSRLLQAAAIYRVLSQLKQALLPQAMMYLLTLPHLRPQLPRTMIRRALSRPQKVPLLQVTKHLPLSHHLQSPQPLLTTKRRARSRRQQRVAQSQAVMYPLLLKPHLLHQSLHPLHLLHQRPQLLRLKPHHLPPRPAPLRLSLHLPPPRLALRHLLLLKP
jgi:hypothetical protein